MCEVNFYYVHYITSSDVKNSAFEPEDMSPTHTLMVVFESIFSCV